MIRLLLCWRDPSLSHQVALPGDVGWGAGPSPSSLSSSLPALQRKLCSPVKQNLPPWWRGRPCIINAARGIGVLQCCSAQDSPVLQCSVPCTQPSSAGQQQGANGPWKGRKLNGAGRCTKKLADPSSSSSSSWSGYWADELGKVDGTSLKQK